MASPNIADMLAVVAPSYSDPSNYQLSNVPKPVISDPTEILIQVHAASVNPIDVKLASGIFKFALKDEYGPLGATFVETISHSL
jgi:NADPH:quinone reductase-like Zn-dependent oxidoreductase